MLNDEYTVYRLDGFDGKFLDLRNVGNRALQLKLSLVEMRRQIVERAVQRDRN